MPGDLSHNFSLAEFAQPARHGFAWTLPPAEVRPEIQRLVNLVLQPLRDQLHMPITIISGWRSWEYNRKIDGAKFSYHPRGMAADIQVAGVTPTELHDEVMRRYRAGLLPGLGGLGYYPGFLHVDIRDKVGGRLARWSGRRKKT